MLGRPCVCPFGETFSDIFFLIISVFWDHKQKLYLSALLLFIHHLQELGCSTAEKDLRARVNHKLIMIQQYALVARKKEKEKEKPVVYWAVIIGAPPVIPGKQTFHSIWHS